MPSSFKYQACSPQLVKYMRDQTYQGCGIGGCRGQRSAVGKVGTERAVPWEAFL